MTKTTNRGNFPRFMRLDEAAPLPSRAHDTDAGMDLAAHRLRLPSGDMIDFDTVKIAPGDSVTIGTGIAVAIPDGNVGLLFARSSLGVKRRLDLANGVGVVDASYRGEVMLCLRNTSNVDQYVTRGERIGQMVITPVILDPWIEDTDLNDTARGKGGFGSTGTV